MRQALLLSVCAMASRLAMAHDGHGPAAPHLHATDFFGFTLIGLAIAGLVWWRGRK